MGLHPVKACQRLVLDCKLASVPEACTAARAFFTSAGWAEVELNGWELALVEGLNNAIEHVAPEQAAQPVTLELVVSAEDGEARITDHTAGFDLPDVVELPPPEAEGGRGLHLMKALMDEVCYLRGSRENCLILRRRSREPIAVSSSPSQPPDTDPTLDLMTEELASAYESLSAIFRFSAGLQAAQGWEEFCRKWLKELGRIVAADWYVLRLLETKSGELQSFAASPSQRLSLLRLPDVCSPEGPVEVTASVTRNDCWFDAENPLKPGDPLLDFSATATGLAHPLQVNESLVGVLTIARRGSEPPFEAGQVSVIQTIADFLAIHVRNSQFQEQQLRDRLIERDLSIAAQIQKSLLPARLPQPPGFELIGYCASAQQVGGDFYDALPTEDGGLLLAVADVMGKGISAAMFAAMFRSQLRSGAEHARSPGELLTRLNRSLFEDLDRVSMFITVRLVHVDMKSRTLKVAAAGHPPLLIAAPGTAVVQAAVNGLPLGLLPDTCYQEQVLPLLPGARLLLFSDGLTEARDPAGQLLGIEPLAHGLAESVRQGLSGADSKEALILCLRNHEAGAERSDDETFILLAEQTVGET